MATTTSLSALATAPSVGPLKHFWSKVVGAGRAAEGLRIDWQSQLHKVHSDCGFRYVRFHGIYHDDMHVYSEVNGLPVYNFQYCDTLFSAMLEKGVRPFVELGFCPSALAREPESTVFWWKGHISPPKDLDKWTDLVRASITHWISTFGLDEVRQWYFECWNEPNLSAFWAGTRSEYYDLYEGTVQAIKGVDKQLRVGGPSTSNFVPDSRFDGEREDREVQKSLADTEDIDSLQWKPVWLEHFLQWCLSKTLPVDFVSLHPYPTDWALDSNENQSRRVRGLDATPNDLRLVKEILSMSAFPNAEIHITEWNSSPSSRDHTHDYVPAATYIVRTMIASLGLVDTLAYWTFTDVFEEEGAPPTPFHGGFGLINLQGLPKPTFHAFRLLSWLGDEILFRDVDHGAIARDSKTGEASAILYHYPPEMTSPPLPSYEERGVAEEMLTIGRPTKKSITITGLPAGAAFAFQTIAAGHRGDVVSAWKRLGSPATLNRTVLHQLDEYSRTLNVRILNADDEGRLHFEEVLEPWTVVAIKQIGS